MAFQLKCCGLESLVIGQSAILNGNEADSAPCTSETVKTNKKGRWFI